jgi:hypothetical protein
MGSPFIGKRDQLFGPHTSLSGTLYFSHSSIPRCRHQCWIREQSDHSGSLILGALHVVCKPCAIPHTALSQVFNPHTAHKHCKNIFRSIMFCIMSGVTKARFEPTKGSVLPTEKAFIWPPASRWQSHCGQARKRRSGGTKCQFNKNSVLTTPDPGAKQSRNPGASIYPVIPDRYEDQGLHCAHLLSLCGRWCTGYTPNDTVTHWCICWPDRTIT